MRKWMGWMLVAVVALALAGGASGQAPAANGDVRIAPATPESNQAYNLPPDKLAKAVTLGYIRTTLDIAGSLWGIAVLLVLLRTGLAAAISAWAARLARPRWAQGLLFFAAFLVIAAVASLPLDATGHAASLHYGISVQGWGSWLADQGKSLALTATVGSLILLFFNWLVRVAPRWYWLLIWVAAVPLVLLSTFAEPVLIDPIFNKFEPLSAHHERLVQKLETVVARTGNRIPPERMFLMKASEKSNGINAYVTGIGRSKRYVMWDTTTDRLPDDEILFVFGHESAHYVLGHIPQELAGMLGSLLVILWACGRLAEWLVRRRGAHWQVQSLASRQGFLVLVLTLSCAGFLLTPAENTFSRHFEHEADVYGQEAIHGLVPDPQRTAVSGFNHLGEAWLEDPNPSPFIEFWEYSHPSVQTRARFAAQYDPWAGGGHGRFFEK